MTDVSSARRVDVAAVKARYPEFFIPNWRARSLAVGIVALMAAIFVAAILYFDIPWGKILPGLRQLV